MKRIYKKHTDWECYKNGMYSTDIQNETTLTSKSVNLLSNDIEFFKASLKVMDNWIISTDVHLSNVTHNRRSWIGQSACCFMFGTPEIITRKVWALLDSETQNRANLVAEKIIRIYENKNRKVHNNLGEELLF